MPNPFVAPLWRNQAFVRLWSASTISMFGSFLTRFAMPLLVILTLGAGPIEVALLRSVELGAALLVGLVAGAWVDRLRRRPVLIWADLGRAALLGSIAVAFALGALTFWHVLAVTAGAAVLTTFFDAADNALLPTVVEREQLVEANGALTASGSASEFLGFGLSGILVQVLSAPLTILLDAITYVVSALFLVTIRHEEAAPPKPEDREPVLDEIRHGLRLVRHDPVLRAFAGASMLLAGLWGVFGATYILFAIDVLGISPALVGVAAAMGGISSLAGAAVASRATRRFGIGPLAIAALLIGAAGNALIPMAPAGLPLIGLAFLLGQQLVADFGITIYDITEVSVRQALVHDREQGRVAATFSVLGVAAQLAATVVAGVLAELIGLRAVTVIAPFGGLIAAAILWRSPVRGLITLPVLDRRSPLQAAVDAERDQPVGA